VVTDPARPDAAQAMRKAIGEGAVSIGEMKYHLALELARDAAVYEIAAERNVPVMMHIQNFPHLRESVLTTRATNISMRFSVRIPRRISWGMETCSGRISARMYLRIAAIPRER